MNEFVAEEFVTEKKVAKKVIPKVKKVKVKITKPFRYAKKWCDKNTKTLPEGVANWMVNHKKGEIL